MFRTIRDFVRTILELVLFIALGTLFTLVSIAEFTRDSTASGWFFAFLAAMSLLPGAFLAFYRERREHERVSPQARRQLLTELEALIDEGTRLVTRIQRPRQALHDPMNPTHPERGHPDARLAVDFYARAYELLPHGYGNDLRTALRPALDENDRQAMEMVQREAEEASKEGREPRAVYSWHWPVIVEIALKVLSTAHKELGKGN
jgi:hypothetical protein